MPKIFISSADGSWLWIITGCTIVALLLMSGWIIIKLNLGKRKELRRQQIRDEWSDLLAGLLMEEDLAETGVTLPDNFARELRKPFVRAVVTAELVRIGQSLRGQMAETAVILYNRLQLEQHSVRLLHSRRWHRQVKGIQQLSAMQQHKYAAEIQQKTNHANTWVRNEAQLAQIRLDGLNGLRFLCQLRQPLSEWQQFNLLHLLQLQPTGPLPQVTEWLAATNTSVVVFALRLCRLFQYFEYAHFIEGLTNHADAGVRSEAIQCLRLWGLVDGTPAPVVNTTPRPAVNNLVPA